MSGASKNTFTLDVRNKFLKEGSNYNEKHESDFYKTVKQTSSNT